MNIKCPGHFNTEISIKEEFLGLLEKLSASYNRRIEDFYCSLLRPPTRYYLRVNRLRATRDLVLDILAREGWEFYSDSRLEEAIYTLVRGPNRIEDTGRYVVADDSSAERVMIGANLYVPGVKKIVSVSKGDYVTVVSSGGIPVANGYFLMNSKDLARRQGIAVNTVKSLYKAPPVRELSVYAEGLVFDQSYPSMTLPHTIRVPDRAVIADITASPGGKISHLYEIAEGSARAFAVDHTWRKAGRLEKEFARLGHSIRVIKTDSRYLHIDHPWLRPDITVVDPPCTALGVRPVLHPGRKIGDLKNLVKLQRQLLSEAVRITKPGGIIFYSTCTTTLLENEHQIDRLIAERIVEPVESAFPLPRSVFTYYPSYRFVPGVHDYPGFFLVILRKN